ncbi:MAG: hypothetical protein LBD41_05010 [Clostridiales Family XIII bacterium]|nr:hypothetical protein [Clostridiales Family XIII bacterium]
MSSKIFAVSKTETKKLNSIHRLNNIATSVTLVTMAISSIMSAGGKFYLAVSLDGHQKNKYPLRSRKKTSNRYI